MSSDDAAVAPLVRKTAAWSWQLLIIAAATWVLLQFLMRLGVVIVPAALALMLTALLVPAVDFLNRRGAPRGGAVALVLICGLALVGSILAFVITQFADGLPDLADQVTRSIDSARHWLISGPLHLRPDQINHFGDTAIQTIRDHQQELTSGALSTAGTVTEIVTGALLALFTLIFLLLGGRNIWRFMTQIAPATVRQRVSDAGAAGFHSLTGYVRATSVVALVDAVGIGTGLAIMGIPLALPLASLVFLGAFIPLVGAVLSGFVAVVVALLAKGFVYALITLGLIIAVMQLEAHVLQPLVMGGGFDSPVGCRARYRSRRCPRRCGGSTVGRADHRLHQQRRTRASCTRPRRREDAAAGRRRRDTRGRTRPGRATLGQAD